MPKKEYSTEDLLDLLDDSPPPPDEVVEFFKTFEIREGSNKYPCSLIYKAYVKWAENPLKGQPFYVRAKKILPTKLGHRFTYYTINMKLWELEYKIAEVVKKREANKKK